MQSEWILEMQLVSGVWERPLKVNSHGFNVEAVSMCDFPVRVLRHDGGQTEWGVSFNQD